jgi:hypothetical protein
MNVFDAFPNALTTYTFLELVRGTPVGDRIVATTEAQGIFKHRTDLVLSDNQESRESSSRLKIRPSESFVSAFNGNLKGHGIRIEDRDYVILDQTGGDNYEAGIREHISVILQAADFSDWASDES